MPAWRSKSLIERTEYARAERSGVGRKHARQHDTFRLVLSIHRCGRATEHGRSMPARERLAQASVVCRRPLFALRTLLGEIGRAPSEPAQSSKRSRFRSSECRGAKGSSEIPSRVPGPTAGCGDHGICFGEGGNGRGVRDGLHLGSRSSLLRRSLSKPTNVWGASRWRNAD